MKSFHSDEKGAMVVEEEGFGCCSLWQEGEGCSSASSCCWLEGWSCI